MCDRENSTVGIAFRDDGMECDRCFGDDGSAIAKRCCKQFAFVGIWEGDRCWG
ncbi:MAG: hypothetical protein HEQ27_08575 [Dolichospermum sp. JUN01]|nr:hypothetical protein [Dolichospermum sp. JUN01]MBS9394873.1 hypothetical protein [Dolichospermum sp. OL01]MCO5798500.1 hypothetical protein [Dolichospermum sp. OL03]MCS6279207.1 hypothetical protein [Dolichospermum sp.]QSV59935.1 MAG: hypothetical protein HEQ29_17655 [Dolichospermum sp. LBC05a]